MRIGDGGAGLIVRRDCEALEEHASRSAHGCRVAGQLAIVVDGGVQRLVRVLNVVRHHRGEQHGVARCVGLAAEAFEGAAEVAELFLLAPRQHARFLSAAMPNFSSAAPYSRGSSLNGYSPSSFAPKLTKWFGIFLPAQHAKEIRIDHPHHHLVFVLLKNGLSSAGSSSMARAMMWRCAAVPHAKAGDGASDATSARAASQERFPHTAILATLDNLTHSLFGADAGAHTARARRPRHDGGAAPRLERAGYRHRHGGRRRDRAI